MHQFQFYLFMLHVYATNMSYIIWYYFECDRDIPIKFTLSRRMIGAYNYSFVEREKYTLKTVFLLKKTL